VYKKHIALQYIAGSGFAVYRFSPEKNFTDYKSGEIVDLTEDINLFMGIKGKYLFYDQGTSTGPRVLGIVNLENGKEVYKGTWKGDELEFINDHTVIVYNSIENNTKSKGYLEWEEAERLYPSSAMWVTLQAYSFDLNTLKLKKLDGKIFEGAL
jgi:hypothetical protein